MNGDPKKAYIYSGGVTGAGTYQFGWVQVLSPELYPTFGYEIAAAQAYGLSIWIFFQGGMPTYHTSLDKHGEPSVVPRCMTPWGTAAPPEEACVYRAGDHFDPTGSR
jgi:hypothetical protein